MTCTTCNGLRLTFTYCPRCEGVGKGATQYGLMICTECRGAKKYTRRCQDCLPATNGATVPTPKSRKCPDCNSPAHWSDGLKAYVCSFCSKVFTR